MRVPPAPYFVSSSPCKPTVKPLASTKTVTFGSHYGSYNDGYYQLGDDDGGVPLSPPTRAERREARRVRAAEQAAEQARQTAEQARLAEEAEEAAIQADAQADYARRLGQHRITRNSAKLDEQASIVNASDTVIAVHEDAIKANEAEIQRLQADIAARRSAQTGERIMSQGNRQRLTRYQNRHFRQTIAPEPEATTSGEDEPLKQSLWEKAWRSARRRRPPISGAQRRQGTTSRAGTPRSGSRNHRRTPSHSQGPFHPPPPR